MRCLLSLRETVSFWMKRYLSWYYAISTATEIYHHECKKLIWITTYMTNEPKKCKFLNTWVSICGYVASVSCRIRLHVCVSVLLNLWLYNSQVVICKIWWFICTYITYRPWYITTLRRCSVGLMYLSSFKHIHYFSLDVLLWIKPTLYKRMRLWMKIAL